MFWREKFWLLGVTKLQFGESHNFFFFQCALYSSCIGWYNAQYHTFKRTNKLAKLFCLKKSIEVLKLVFWLPTWKKWGGKRGFSFFALELAVGGSVINRDYPVLLNIDYSWIFFHWLRNQLCWKKHFLTMFSKIGCLAQIEVPEIWQASILFKNAWPICFVSYWGTFKSLLKFLALKALRH